MKSVPLLFSAILLSSCMNNGTPGNEPLSENRDSADVIFVNIDSMLLMCHVDSLPQVSFPFVSSFYNRGDFTTINLQEFKNRQLTGIPFKKIPALIGGGSIDTDDDSTFSLADTNYNARWNLINKNPGFLVVEVYSDGARLVTLTYDLKIIDAITTGMADHAGNAHWTANRHSVINKDLTILMQHEYNVQTDDSGNFDTETSEEKWFVDKQGYFRKKD